MKNVIQQVETISRGLLYLIEHVECLNVNSDWVAETQYMLRLAEELGTRLETIASKKTKQLSNGGSSKR